MGSPRFNKSFVAGIVRSRYEASSKEFLESPDKSEARDRAWGAMQALEWLSAGFDLKVTPTSVYIRFVDANGEPLRLSKSSVVTRLVHTAAGLGHQHRFTPKTGYRQVDGKGSYMNRTYGHWEELNELELALGLEKIPTVGAKP